MPFIPTHIGLHELVVDGIGTGILHSQFCPKYLVLVSFFIYFTGPIYRQVVSESTGPICTKFSVLVDVREGFSKRSFILWSLKGRCHGNQLCGQVVNWPTPISFGTLTFQKWLQDRNIDFRILNGNDFFSLCRNLVKFGPANQEFTTSECVHPIIDHYWVESG